MASDDPIIACDMIVQLRFMRDVANRRANEIADSAQAGADMCRDVLAENATLRRHIEMLERKAKR